MSSSSSSSEQHGEDSRIDKGIRLFGVELVTRGAMRKSVSLGNLLHYNGASNNLEHVDPADGYLSDGLVHTSSNARARRKGVPWTEEEHRLFLIGLQKLGKGDWRGISRNFVKTRTPTQVASHAQKYFIRQSNLSKRKRRSSLFDISPEADLNVPEISVTSNDLPAPFLQLGLAQELLAFPIGPSMVPLAKIMEEKPYVPEEEDACKLQEPADLVSHLQSGATLMPVVSVPQVAPPLPSSWLGLGSQDNPREACVTSSLRGNVVKPIPSIATGVEDTRLNLGLALEPSLLSLELEQPLRHSAFHVSPTFGNNRIASGGLASPIQCT